jgi:serine kinase of HPr protein (carbohydrate metabolism regulator)
VEQMKKIYSIHNLYRISLSGKGRIADNIDFQLKNFSINNALLMHCDKILEVCTKKIDKGLCSTLGKFGSIAYQRINDKLLVIKDNQSIELDGSIDIVKQSHINLEENADEDLTIFFLESIIRMNLINEGIALLHSAAVAQNNRGLLLLAWQGTGKTTSCLSFVKNGFDFMADDRVWVNCKGEIFAYPRYVRINKSNIHVFYKDLDIKSQLQYSLCVKLETLLKHVKIYDRSKRVKKVFNSGILLPKIALDIHDFKDNADICNKAELSFIIYLEKNEINNGITETISIQVMKDIIVGINNYEWNNRLLSYAVAHDILFPEGPKWVQEVENFKSNECIVVSNILKDVTLKKYNLKMNQDVLPVDIINSYKHPGEDL